MKANIIEQGRLDDEKDTATHYFHCRANTPVEYDVVYTDVEDVDSEDDPKWNKHANKKKENETEVYTPLTDESGAVSDCENFLPRTSQALHNEKQLTSFSHLTPYLSKLLADIRNRTSLIF